MAVSRKPNCTTSRAHGFGGSGWKHQHCRDLQDQSGCLVPPHFHRKADQSEAWRQWRLVVAVFSTRAITSLNVLCGSHVFGEVTSLRKNWQTGAPYFFDMRGNTFADEMASRAATRVEVLPSQAHAAKSIDGVALASQTAHHRGKLGGLGRAAQA